MKHILIVCNALAKMKVKTPEVNAFNARPHTNKLRITARTKFTIFTQSGSLGRDIHSCVVTQAGGS